MADVFQMAVMRACAALLAAVGVACLAAWLRPGWRRVRAQASPAALAVLALLAAAATVEAQKRRPARAAHAPPPRFLSPSGAVTNARWRARGAYEDWFYLQPSNWWARAADGGWTEALRVFSFGGFQARGADGMWHAHPPPFPQKFSLAPEANWHLLGGGESLFWHAATPSNTLLLTWQDALYARSHTNLVSFQAELFNDGAVAYRYGGSPDDFIHPAPTNWDYGVACAWDDATVNSNAYYFVDVSAARGPAAISFTGDRPSALGDPRVVTRGGETNRVPLLIGIRYAVTSDTPFAVSFADSGFATVTTNGPRSAEIVWPLEFQFTEGFADGSRVYAVGVVPYDPGGVFSWEEPGGAPRLRGTRDGGCGCVSYSGRSVVFGCSPTCGCGGGCAVGGTYMLEGAVFSATGGVCRCGFDDPPPYDPQTHEPTEGAGVSVSFGAGAVIYEDDYEDSPGVWRDRRSTRVRLDVSASGGPRGGTLSLSSQNLGKLSPVACGPLMLPSQVQIAAGGIYGVSFLCEAAEHSASQDDVWVRGVFTENDTGESFTNAAALTVVKVGLNTLQNHLPPYTRRVYGIHEEVQCNSLPALSEREWRCGGGTISYSGGVMTLTCGWHAYSGNVIAECNGAELKLPIRIVEPSEIRCLGVEISREPSVPAGVAGGIGMLLDLYVFPTNVSFYNIALMEVPTYDGYHSGYFDNLFHEPAWDHNTSNGAGNWKIVFPDNRWNLHDNPSFKAFTSTGQIAAPPPWASGLIVWNIPIGWGERDSASGTDPIGMMGTVYNQMFTIYENGTVTVYKFGNSASRSTNGVVRLNGVIVP